MNKQLKKHFVKITPFFILVHLGVILCSIGVIYIWFDDNNHGGLASGLLAILLLLFGVAYIVDRYLVKKLKYRTVLIFEFIAIPLLVIAHQYTSRETIVQVDTEKRFIPVLYFEKGLHKEQIPRSALFDRKIVMVCDSLLHLDIGLLDDDSYGLAVPHSWGGYFQKTLDTVVNNKMYRLHLFYNDVPQEERELIFERYKKQAFIN